MTAIALALALLLAFVHVFATHLVFLDRAPRSRWLSAASGLSVAYVFVHLLPEIASGHEALAEGRAAQWPTLWLVTLAGLVVFYGLERLAKGSRQDEAEAGREETTAPAVFWLHIASFALYNVLIGYLLMHRLDEGPAALIAFGLAMSLHFVVNDHGLHAHHRRRYRHVGRWLLAGAVLIGYALGLGVDVGEPAIVSLIAFLGGGVVLNVLKEELPEERQSRFVPFALGAAAYAALLVAI
ncbi:hypothetical protein [Cognatilysobacter bugurensis]|uniref:ZIP Zinc transporter n=1 Tax=Cognatilysobacter bugurensis TaxID=543356 RepID=A0A918SYI6_9GAMM|nr:hypothetical protein [Lysobacter bugurensis]GHA79316.1 hypothetical protein GCM10007067_16000 [Lysobacter bugurensis]